MAALVVGGWLVARAFDVSIPTLARQIVVELQRIHPVVFFAGMAVLPAFGVPLSPFAFAAGPAYAGRLGTATVVLLAIASVAANTAFSYWIARLLKTRVERFIGWFGYRLPAVEADMSWNACVAVRLAPGLPFWVQSYALGLAGIAWVPYLVVSTLVPSVYLSEAIIGGEAAWRGGVGAGVFGLSLVVFAAVAVFLWRKFRRRANGRPANGL
jgi:uncharacterized membrane protein YdjX (TVP38/TMEM64 family)